MERRNFLGGMTAASTALAFRAVDATATQPTPPPLAITMWDFSWLERRWPGAGYEDWDAALDGLLERGYDAVRIDAFPHLVATDALARHTLLPVWDQQVWGSPALVDVQVQPQLNTFIAKCRDRKIRVGLSTWYREDTQNLRMRISSAAVMGEMWAATLDSIDKAGLLDAIAYVDLCNEWPGDLWTPFFTNDPPEQTWTYWHTAKSMSYMRAAVDVVRKAYPGLPVCFSFTGGQPALYAEKDLSFFDLLEHHTWMMQIAGDEYARAVGYKYERFSSEGYKNLVKNHATVYRDRREHWRKLLVDEILLVAASAARARLPLVTTECWGLVDFKDWPGLDWEIVKELCELGVTTAAATGRWAAIATSNFCGPQFVGMWRDIQWHRRLTQTIKTSSIATDMGANALVRRLAALSGRQTG